MSNVVCAISITDDIRCVLSLRSMAINITVQTIHFVRIVLRRESETLFTVIDLYIETFSIRKYDSIHLTKSGSATHLLLLNRL